MRKDFSKVLKELRINAGYSQKQVYDILGIRQSTFSAWETGRAEPSADMLLKLCKLYKVNDIFAAFGYDGYNEDGSIQLNIYEIDLIEKYRDLDDHGKDMVNTVLEKEHKRWESEQKDNNIIKLDTQEHFSVNAAHTRTDIPEADKTNKLRQQEEDIMDDPDF